MATTVDGNEKLIPVEFSIAEVGYAPTWEWFLNHLKIFLVVNLSTMTIVSDRHSKIIAVVSKVYLNVHHVFYYYHLSYNAIIDIHGRPALGLFWAIAKVDLTTV